MAVLAGLNSAAILRLKLTRESVKTKNKKLYNQFLDLELLMSSERFVYHIFYLYMYISFTKLNSTQQIIL
jgi:hypothetical protein